MFCRTSHFLKTGLLLVNLGFWISRFPDFRFSRFYFLHFFGETRSGACGSQKLAHHLSAHFCLVKTPSKPMWDCFVFGVGGVGWDATVYSLHFLLHRTSASRSMPPWRWHLICQWPLQVFLQCLRMTWHFIVKHVFCLIFPHPSGWGC